MRLIKEYELAKTHIDNSEVVAFPTETVMGLGIYFDDYSAYQLLNKIKNRSSQICRSCSDRLFSYLCNHDERARETDA